MNVRKFYSIRIGKLLLGMKMGRVKMNFSEKVTLIMNMFIVNPVTTLKVKKVSRLQRKKSQMQTAWVHQQNLHFLHKVRKFFLPKQK